MRRLWVLLAIATAVVCVAVAVAMHVWWMLPNHDNEFCLVVAERILDGGTYMTDFQDPNPPLIMLMNIPPVLAAQLTGWDIYTCFSIYVGVLILLALWGSARPLAACLGSGPDASVSGVALAVALCAVVLAFTPGYEYGQREHLFTILFLPFLLWASVRAVSGPTRLTTLDVALIVAGAIGSMMKPFFLLVPLCLLALRVAGPERWRAMRDPAVTVFALVVMLYVLLIVMVFPEFLEAAVLQLAVYSAWGQSWATVIDRAQQAVWPLCLLVVVAMLAPVRESKRSTLVHCIVAAMACLAIAVAQKRGLRYHMLPAEQLSLAGLAVMAAAMLPRLRRRHALAFPALTMMAMTGTATAMSLTGPYLDLASVPRSRFEGDPLLSALRDRAHGQPVMLLTGGFLMGFPSLAEVELGASSVGQVLLPGTVILSRGNAAERAQAESLRPYVVAQLVNDLQRFRPTIVAVDRRPARQALPADFDILAYYASDPQFRKEWAAYRMVATVSGWDLYRRDKVSGRDDE